MRLRNRPSTIRRLPGGSLIPASPSTSRAMRPKSTALRWSSVSSVRETAAALALGLTTCSGRSGSGGGAGQRPLVLGEQAAEIEHGDEGSVAAADTGDDMLTPGAGDVGR